MKRNESGFNKAVGALAVIVGIVAGAIAIYDYILTDIYYSEGSFNNSNGKAGRFVECKAGFIMESCEVTYINNDGVVDDFSGDNCRHSGVDRSKALQRCAIPSDVSVENGHMCSLKAKCVEQ
tara:strand:+ start:219 stop:584 length:366 start_codon:yes stop_codon:yes gene_type:complete